MDRLVVSHGGGCHLRLLAGNADGLRNVLVVGRSNRSFRSIQIDRLAAQMRDWGFAVWRLEPQPTPPKEGAAIPPGSHGSACSSMMTAMSSAVSRCIPKVFGYYPSWADYLSPSYAQVIERRDEVQSMLDQFPVSARFLLLGHSMGARVGTYLDRQSRVSGHVGFGYPFQHPEEGPALSRVYHLRKLKVPTLIIQGRNDAYGGEEVARTYRFNPSISFLFVEDDHSYNSACSNLTWQITTRVGAFIAETQGGLPCEHSCGRPDDQPDQLVGKEGKSKSCRTLAVS
ncbi:alpha/beta family hydrolase [Pseudovibrio exalbescens]|uniref:KANL3/Tex30 alpha/beta hydrolase-like domain-containing protein n=1 Tax=Pseudovibrio exalbescens TaxID=197461 RepID=A0A1U7JF43_9HYPH|nr:alpha/beta family hydrolase [Pseudovibrio exalbescens]OKL43304.1 hypothetical protein A3843_13840 [Pseudovibrio exalbescens]